MKKSTLTNTIIILSTLVAITGFGGFLFWLFSGEPSATQLAQLHLIWYV